jgi:HSP20 family protein
VEVTTMMRKAKATEIAPKASESFPLWGGAADPFRVFADMDRWIDDVRREFGRVLTPWSGTALTLEDGTRVPAVDVRDEGAEFVVTAELPGVSKDQIEIEATPESLEIRAEVRGEREEKDEKYYFRERTFRGYRRALDLPAEVVPEKAAAQLKDGILEIRLPKKEPTPAPKAVQVKVQ